MKFKYGVALLVASASLNATTFIYGGSLTGWTHSNLVEVVAPGASFGPGSLSSQIDSSSFGIYNTGGPANTDVFGTYGGNNLPNGTIDAETAFGLTPGTISNTLSRTTDYGYVTKNFTFNAGQTYSFAWSYLGDDEPGYKDGSFFAVSGQGAQIFNFLAVNNYDNMVTQYISDPAFSSTMLIVGNSGLTGWQTTSFTVATTGTYQFSIGTFNEGDWGVSPRLLVAAGSAAVPEPSTYGLILGGLALALVSVRRRKSN